MLGWLLAALALGACAPAPLPALPTLIPTLTPRRSAAGETSGAPAGPGEATATPLIVVGGGAEPTLTPPRPETTAGPPTRAPETPTSDATPTPLIAPPPSPTAFSPLAPLAFVPAGEFEMGSPPGSDPFAEQWERPAHTVALSAFWLETQEVSNARYALCVTAGVCSLPLATGSRTRSDYYANPGYADYPMVNVSYAQAVGYCAWAGGRLPTEAEWEYAARFPDGRRYPWGNEADLGRGNFGRPEGSDTDRVDAFPTGASALGVLNLAGNVWEWVQDWYDPEYYAASPQRDPAGPAAGAERVARGGAFATDAQYARAANRLGRDPNRGYDNLGFRCALTDLPVNAPRLPTLTPAP